MRIHRIGQKRTVRVRRFIVKVSFYFIFLGKLLRLVLLFRRPELIQAWFPSIRPCGLVHNLTKLD